MAEPAPGTTRRHHGPAARRDSRVVKRGVRMSRAIRHLVVLAVASIAALALLSGSAVAAGGHAGFDCNGYGLHSTSPGGGGGLCTDMSGIAGERAEDGEHYIGHDEANINFYSTVKGSGYTSRY